MDFLFKNITSEAVDQVLDEVWKDKGLQDAILKSIQTRLRTKGTDKDNFKLRTNTATRGFTTGGFYSKTTEGIKKILDKVNLLDTGKLYSSMTARAVRGGLDLSADFQKGSENVWDNFTVMYSSQKEFEDAIMNLSRDNYDTIIENWIIPLFIDKFLIRIL